jgi:hypothetical protein
MLSERVVHKMSEEGVETSHNITKEGNTEITN